VEPAAADEIEAITLEATVAVLSLPLETDPEAEADDAAPELEAAVEEEATLELETALQERSYNGLVLKVLPTSPKLGLGVVASASC